jgi:glucosamine--fructose-6-phosphate aminotransferase (isomerizing)
MTDNAYHMLRYIHEIPNALRRTLADNETAVGALLEKARARQIERILVAGVGSSYTAALMAAPLFRCYCALPVYIYPSTEVGPFMTSLVDEHTLFISVSRSGERGWVVDSLKEAIGRGAMGLAVTGMRGSLLAENAQHVLVTCEGPEITFAKTKSVATCSGLLMRLALAFAGPEDASAQKQLERLQQLPDLLSETIASAEPQVQALMPALQAYKMVMAAGTVGNYGTALEFAIKLPEAASIPVIPNDTGNMLHGPWSQVSEEWLALLLVTAYDLELSKTTLQLAGKLGAHRLVILEPGLEASGLYEHLVTLPQPADPLTAGLVYLIPVQLLTYYWSLARGENPDAPAAMRVMLDAMLPPGREEPEMRSTA